MEVGCFDGGERSRDRAGVGGSKGWKFRRQISGLMIFLDVHSDNLGTFLVSFRPSEETMIRDIGAAGVVPVMEAVSSAYSGIHATGLFQVLIADESMICRQDGVVEDGLCFASGAGINFCSSKYDVRDFLTFGVGVFLTFWDRFNDRLMKLSMRQLFFCFLKRWILRRRRDQVGIFIPATEGI